MIAMESILLFILIFCTLACVIIWLHVNPNSQPRTYATKQPNKSTTQHNSTYSTQHNSTYSFTKKKHNKNTAIAPKFNSASPYDVLGLTEDCSHDDIHYHYRCLVKQYHPDINKDPNSIDLFMAIQKAYKFLDEHHIESEPVSAKDIMYSVEKKIYNDECKNCDLRHDCEHAQYSIRRMYEVTNINT